SGACGLEGLREGLGSALAGLFDFGLEDVIRIKILSQWTAPHPRPALVHIALRRGEGNGLGHRAGMTSPPARFAPLATQPSWQRRPNTGVPSRHSPAVARRQ